MRFRGLTFFLLLLVLFCPKKNFGQTQKSFKQWESEITAFELSDKTKPPPRNAILFIGSSSFRIWKTVAQDFPEYKIINRGFGGSQIPDINHYFNRIVTPYKPKVIVFYAGDNDLSEGKTAGDIFDGFKTFCVRVHRS